MVALQPHARMNNPVLNRRSLSRILFGVYLLPLFLVCFSLSVPPADLPLCGLMFALAVGGLILVRRDTRFWRVVWTTALIASVLFGVLELVAGKRIAHQFSHRAAFVHRAPIFAASDFSPGESA